MWILGLLLVRSPKKRLWPQCGKDSSGEGGVLENRVEPDPPDLRCNPLPRTEMLSWNPLGRSQA